MNIVLRHLSAALVLTLALVLSGCTFPAAYHAAAPAPCSVPVAPIRNHALAVTITVNFTYNAVNAGSYIGPIQQDILARLNADGGADGNTFVLANGVEPNFIMNYTVNDIGSNQYTGGLVFNGWGEYIGTFGSGAYPFNDDALFYNLTDQAYAFIHGGWHDSRPTCPQS